MKKLNRNYQGSDGYMLKTSSALHRLYVDNIADFTALDSTLNVKFGKDWKVKIVAGYQVEQHSLLKDYLGVKTEVVLEIMEKCRAKYKEVKFFANKTFTRAHELMQFGGDNYKNVRIRQSDMISFMDEIHKSCIKHSVALLANGMIQTQIDEIATLRDNLMNANTDQENYAKEIKALTQDRITLLNKCYKDTKLVIEAAMVVYAEDFARRNAFIYSPSTGSEPDSEIVNAIAMEDIPTEIYTVDYDASRQFILTNNGPAEVEFYLADTDTEFTTRLPVSIGETITVDSTKLGETGGKLFAKIIPETGSEANLEVEISL